MTRDEITAKLVKVERLVMEGATAGERQAAASVAEGLRARLGESADAEADRYVVVERALRMSIEAAERARIEREIARVQREMAREAVDDFMVMVDGEPVALVEAGGRVTWWGRGLEVW